MTSRRKITQQKFEEDDQNIKTDFFNDFSDGNASEIKPEAPIRVTAQDEKKPSTVTQRYKTGFSIFGTFILLIAMGPLYCSLLVLIIEVGFFREIINLKRNYMKETLIKSSVFLVWYIFINGIVYLFFWNFQQMLETAPNNAIRFIANYRNLIFFVLYIIGFSGYVVTLKFGYIRYQIRLFMETHISLLVCCIVGSSMIVIYDGLIWFVAAALAVIVNDVCAYTVGLRIGRTRLIDLSPKKTLEGFIGGMVGTLIIMQLVG